MTVFWGFLLLFGGLRRKVCLDSDLLSRFIAVSNPTCIRSRFGIPGGSGLLRDVWTVDQFIEA